jgi:hypothetical protein
MLVPVLVLASLSRASTCDPPCEQGLAGMEAGAGSFHHHFTHNPPHEQWLVGLGAGGVLSIVIRLSSSSFNVQHSSLPINIRHSSSFDVCCLFVVC